MQPETKYFVLGGIITVVSTTPRTRRLSTLDDTMAGRVLVQLVLPKHLRRRVDARVVEIVEYIMVTDIAVMFKRGLVVRGMAVI